VKRGGLISFVTTASSMVSAAIARWGRNTVKLDGGIPISDAAGKAHTPTRWCQAVERNPFGLKPDGRAFVLPSRAVWFRGGA